MTVQVEVEHHGSSGAVVPRLVYEALAEALAARGVQMVFCVLGDAILELMAHAAASCGIQLVHARHEQGAVAMADGYARATGLLGVCAVTCGPGLTNAVTSLATATRHGSSVLLLAGDVALGDRRNVQRLDQQRLVETIGTRCLSATSGRSAVVELAAAFRYIESGHGPAVLNLPVDVQQAELDAVPRLARWREPLCMLVEPDPFVLEGAAAAVAAAERPALLVGRGAVTAAPAVIALAERAGAPIVTTLRAKGLGHGHPLEAGVSGALGDPAAAKVLGTADVVCVLGARLDAWTTSGGRLLAGAAHVIQVDRDAAMLGDAEHVTMPVLGDAGSAARRLVALLETAGVSRTPWWTRPFAQVPGDPCTCAGRVHPAHAVRALDLALGEDRVIVLDGGHFAIFSAQGLTAFDPAQFIFTSDFGAIGQGLSVAIGAACGAPGRRVTAVLGDGCLMMGLADLDTIAQLQLPLTLFVMNDGGFGQERHSLAAKGFSTHEAVHPTPDLVRLARAAGLAAHRMATCRDLDDLQDVLAHADGPLLVDVQIDGTILNPAARAIFEHARAGRGASSPRGRSVALEPVG